MRGPNFQFLTVLKYRTKSKMYSTVVYGLIFLPLFYYFILFYLAFSLKGQYATFKIKISQMTTHSCAFVWAWNGPWGGMDFHVSSNDWPG